MVTAIWIMFLVALAILLPLPALGDWGRQPGRRSRPPSVSQRLRPVDTDRPDPDYRGRESHPEHGGQESDPRPQIVAEAREAELTHELFSGAIDPATYRQRMSDLAHLRPTPDNKHRAT